LIVILWIVIGLAALGCLVKASDFFVGAAERVGGSLGLSPFAIGISIVALGTSLPELASGIVAVLSGASEIAVATAVGSNITNILLILGLAGVLGGGLHVAYELVRVDLPFLFGSALLLTLVAVDGQVGWRDAFLCLGTFGIYLAYIMSSGAAPGSMPGTAVAAAGSNLAPDPLEALAGSVTKTWLTLIVSGGFIHLGAHFTVQSVVNVSQMVGIGTEIIATSVIALGTSLPELAVTLRSAREGKPEVAVGNVIGSNVFNALGVVGASALFGTLVVSDTILYFALPAMIGTTTLCFFVLQERELTRWDGWLLLALYLGFSLQLYG
jgi:cation:H+ antiporter